MAVDSELHQLLGNEIKRDMNIMEEKKIGRPTDNEGTKHDAT